MHSLRWTQLYDCHVGSDPTKARTPHLLPRCCCRSLPSSLLLLSRAFTVTAPIGGPKKPVVGEDTLREAISTLPDEAVEDVEVTATARWVAKH